MSRLRRIRDLRGLEPHWLAKELRITSPSYYDLEADRENWIDEISIKKLRHLCRLLDVSPSTLIDNRGAESLVLGCEEFARRIGAYLSEKGMTASELSDKIGWDVSGLLTDPTQVGNLNAAGFKAICEALSLNWLNVLDEMKL